jgi:hypothetical protein
MRKAKIVRYFTWVATLSLILCLSATAGPSAQHALTIASGVGGSVQVAVSTGDYCRAWAGGVSLLLVDDGAAVQVIATPEPGWRFMNWIGTVGSNGPTFSFTMTKDWKLEAIFELDQGQPTLVVTCGSGGTVVRPGVGSFAYERGTVVVAEAVANNGYRFSGWTGSLVDSKNVESPQLSQTNVVANNGGTLHANFEPMQEDFHEDWQMASVGSFTPSNAAFILADEGFWALRDALGASASCGPTPQRARILTLDSDQALMLTSSDSASACSDTVSVLLSRSDSLNSGFGVSLAANTVISFDEVGELCNPGLHGSGRDCLVPPCFDNISVILTDNNGNTLAYVLQRYPEAVANLRNVNLGDTYREVFLNPTGIRYQRNLFNDFQTIPAFRSAGAQIDSIEFRVDAHGSAIIDKIIIKPGTAIETVPVYRFWSPGSEAHILTTSETERQDLSNANSGDWVPEGISCFALPYGSDPNAAPVYQFWSPVLSSHFYTLNEVEKNKLLKDKGFSDIWRLEGIAFYAYAEGRHPAAASPLYRFWSPITGDHTYTISERERDKLLNGGSNIWTFEGVAWYAYQPWPYAATLSEGNCSK